MFRKILKFILQLFGLKIADKEQEEGTLPANVKKEAIYRKKSLMSETEYNFYLKMKPLEEEYRIVSQLNLASVIQKISTHRYQTELYRNIDFAIFSKDYKELLLLIELNDSTHNQKSRRKRDLNVQKICDECQIKLIKFYTNCPNEQTYVINRIRRTIYEDKSTIEIL